MAWRDDLQDWQSFSTGLNSVGSTREAMDFLELKAWTLRSLVPLWSTSRRRPVGSESCKGPKSNRSLRSNRPNSGRNCRSPVDSKAERPHMCAGQHNCPSSTQSSRSVTPHPHSSSARARRIARNNARVGDASGPPIRIRCVASWAGLARRSSGLGSNHLLSITSHDPHGRIEHSPPFRLAPIRTRGH
jgi:hypothetical protein